MALMAVPDTGTCKLSVIVIVKGSEDNTFGTVPRRVLPGFCAWFLQKGHS